MARTFVHHTLKVQFANTADFKQADFAIKIKVIHIDFYEKAAAPNSKEGNSPNVLI